MEQYHNLLRYVLEKGVDKGDRTGTGTRSVFGYQMRFDLEDGFPLVTTKKVSFKFIAKELIWFLQGCKGGIQALHDSGVTIWDEWLDKEQEGKIIPYGTQWRKWKVVNDNWVGNNSHYVGSWRTKDGAKDIYWSESGENLSNADGYYIDQLSDLISEMKNNPNSRRLILESWNVGKMSEFALPPCHKMAQFNITNGKLSCLVYIRSNDLFLGSPYNIAQYALLTHILANICDLNVGDLVVNIGDAHIYSNHFEQVKLQLTRHLYSLPTLTINRKLNGIEDIDTLDFSGFTLTNYQSHPAIKAEVSV